MSLQSRREKITGPQGQLSSLSHIWPEPNPDFRVLREAIKAGNIVIGRQYFLRQAATLLEFAQSTNDPGLAADLLEKASNLLSQIESSAGLDQSPRAPDVEPENRA
jgi:hypothetical protein